MKYYLVSYMHFYSNGFGAGHAWVSTDTVFNYIKFKRDLNLKGEISLININEVSEELFNENKV